MLKTTFEAIFPAVSTIAAAVFIAAGAQRLAVRQLQTADMVVNGYVQFILFFDIIPHLHEILPGIVPGQFYYCERSHYQLSDQITQVLSAKIRGA